MKRGKNVLKNAVTLGVIVALIAAMTASVAGAHPGKGKAYGLDRQPICHKPADETTNVEEGEESDVEEGEESGRTLYLPKPAIKAHLKHGDELGACSETPAACDGDPVAGAEIEVDSTRGADPDVVDTGDVLSIDLDGDFELAERGTVSVPLEDEDGTQGTFEDGANAEITEEDGDLRIAVKGDPIDEAGIPVVLDIDGLTGVSSEGVSCADEVIETSETTEAGGPTPKISSAEKTELDSQRNQKERLSEHPKGKQVEAKGKGKK